MKATDQSVENTDLL